MILQKHFWVTITIAMILICILLPSNLYAQQETGVESFVIRLYQTCLEREPDTPGLANWVNHLSSGYITGGQAAYGFVFSQELTGRNLSNDQFLKVMYEAFFGRSPDQEGFNNWLSVLQGGTSREKVFSHFVNSQEFNSICNAYGIIAGSTQIKDKRTEKVKQDSKIRGSSQFYELISEALELLSAADPEAYSQYKQTEKIIETSLDGALAVADGRCVYIDLSKREFNDINFAKEIACTLSHEFNHISNWDYYRRTGDYYGMEIMAFSQQYNTAKKLGMPINYLRYISWVIDNIYYLYYKQAA